MIIMKNARSHFDNHVRADKLYFTSDNLAFFEEQNALNHAKGLQDRKITTMTREEVDTELEELANYDPENDLLADPYDEYDAE